MAPGVILLGELFRGGRGRSPREAWRGIPPSARWGLAGFAVPLAALFAVRFVVIKGFLISKEAGIFELENPLVVMSFPVRAVNALSLALRYLGKTFLPIHLSADHSAYALPLVRSLREPGGVAGSRRGPRGRDPRARALEETASRGFRTVLLFGHAFSRLERAVRDRHDLRGAARVPSVRGPLLSRGGPPRGARARGPAAFAALARVAPSRRRRRVRGRDGRAQPRLEGRRDALRRHGREGPALGEGPLQRGLGRAAREPPRRRP